MKKIFSVIFIAAILFACNNEANKDETAAAPETKTDKPAAPVELIMDSNLVTAVKATQKAFENKDIDAYTANMADDVRFNWSGGDSLVGKQAVKDYYTGRFAVIDNISFSNDIFLPLMSQQSPNGGVTAAGKWMLHWYMVDVKYKNGKSLNFWVHTASHYNDAGKIDQIAQYIDRKPIAEASK
jgi:hypothetical protein